MSIVEKYEKYTLNADVRSQDELLNCCFDYDFKEFNSDMESIKNIYKSFFKRRKNMDFFRGSLLKGKISMWSNGSSGGESKYFLGPHAHNLLVRVEEFQRNTSNHNLLKISTFHPIRKNFNRVENGGYIIADFSSKECVGFIVDFLEKNLHKTHVEVYPNIFMMMCCHDDLIDYLKKRSIVVITTGDDAYVSSKFKAIDRMIDWKTGCNFYECMHEGKHVIPLWFEEDGISYNILNLYRSERAQKADILETEGFSDCGCGRKKCDIKMTSHFEYKPKIKGLYFDHMDALRKVKGKYINLQFVFDESHVLILMDELSGQDEATIHEDRKSLADHLGGLGLSTSFEKSYAYLGNRKRPMVWIGSKTMVIEE
jgi:hypothetical protein